MALLGSAWSGLEISQNSLEKTFTFSLSFFLFGDICELKGEEDVEVTDRRNRIVGRASGQTRGNLLTGFNELNFVTNKAGE